MEQYKKLNGLLEATIEVFNKGNFVYSEQLMYKFEDNKLQRRFRYFQSSVWEITTIEDFNSQKEFSIKINE